MFLIYSVALSHKLTPSDQPGRKFQNHLLYWYKFKFQPFQVKPSQKKKKPVFVHKVLLEHSHAHLFTYCLLLASHNRIE